MPISKYWSCFKLGYNYYPFGLSFNSYQRVTSRQNDYLYNGKELQDELDLNWLDYGARMYDPAIARWSVIDPLSELSRQWSPYTYVYNNPLIFIDPDGMFGRYYDENGGLLYDDGIDDGEVYLSTQNDVGVYGFEGGEEILRLNSVHLGTENEFGLIQLTGMGNDNIENYGNEDNYSYTKEDGTTSEEGQHGDDWVTPSVGAAFYAAVNEFSEANEGDITVRVNDASAFNPAKNLGHSTHFTGESIDMPFMTTDGGSSNNISNLSTADKTLNGNFVDILKTKGFNKNYSDNGTIPNTTHSAGHKDHLHVGVKKN